MYQQKKLFESVMLLKNQKLLIKCLKDILGRMVLQADAAEASCRDQRRASCFVLKVKR